MRFFLTCLIFIFFTFPSLSKAEESFDFTLQLQQPPNNIVSHEFEAWAERIKEESGGRLSPFLIHSAAITRVEGSYNGIKKGTVEMSLFPTTNNVRELPYSTSVSLPFLTKDAEHATKIAWAMYEQIPELQAELSEDIVLLGIITSAQNVFLSRKAPVLIPADMKNKRVLIPGTGFSALEISALGGNPVVTQATDTYISMQRGMGDIAYQYIASVIPFKLDEVAKYGTVLSLNINPMYLGANKDFWEELPEDLQILLTESLKELTLSIGKTLHENSNEQIEILRASGMEIKVLTEEESAQFKAMLLADENLMDYWRKIFRDGGISDPDAWIEEVYSFAAGIE